MQHFEFTIIDENIGERIDKCISVMYEDFSRSYIQKIIKDSKVLVNGKVVKGSYILKENDHVIFDCPDSVIPDILPENIPLDILYEDEDVIVVNKPKEMVVHPAPGHYSGTLVNGLMYYMLNSSTDSGLSSINGVLRPGIVHRIDMNTTGSLIICKNDKAHLSIAKQLKEHSINRVYVSIVKGVIDDSDGKVDKPIGRSDKDRKKMAVNAKNSKNAVTHYKVLERFKNYTLIECKLETGRTHQIRVHMSSIGHPVLGDDVYNSEKCPYKLTGQTLHAKTLGFIQPSTGEYVEVNVPLPDYFEELITKLRY